MRLMFWDTFYILSNFVPKIEIQSSRLAKCQLPVSYLPVLGKKHLFSLCESEGLSAVSASKQLLRQHSQWNDG